MNAVFGQTTAPYEPLFKKLQDNWNNESEAAQDSIVNDNLSKFDWAKHTGEITGFQAEKVLEFCVRALRIDTFDRGDYKTVCSLKVIFLGGAIPRFKFPRPGAMHNARFMAKAIYLAMF